MSDKKILKPGQIISLGEEEFVGAMPIRQEIEVIPESPPKKLGWMCYEMTEEDVARENSKEHLNNLKEIRNTHAGYEYKEHVGWSGYTLLPVLQDLWGRPWNRAAMNFIESLRPSQVRIIKYKEFQTCDCMSWRVTVHLDEHENIKDINQEVKVGLDGFRNGHDASLYLSGKLDLLEKPQPTCYFNPRGLAGENK